MSCRKASSSPCLGIVVMAALISLFSFHLGATPTADADSLNLNRHPLVHSLELNLGADYMASSTVDEIREENDDVHKVFSHSALPINLKYSFSFTDPAVRNYLPGGYQGIGLGILNIGVFDSGGLRKSTGYIHYPVSLYVFQGGPFWHINPSLSMDYEWNFGASFGWKPYSETNEFYNLTVGSRVNAYLNLGIRLKWQIERHFALTAGVAVNHYSNGNTSWPNPGVNSFGVRIGAVYTFNPQQIPAHEVTTDTLEKRRKLEYDILLWGSARKRVYRGGDTPVLLPGHFGCAGISFAPMVRLGEWWRLGGSADIQWDGSSAIQEYIVVDQSIKSIRLIQRKFIHQVSWGISAHGELQMPVFALNVGLGYNLVAPKENRGFYQNIALKTYIGSKFFINIGYQLRNFYQQSNLMLGCGLSI